MGYAILMNSSFLQSPDWGKFQESVGVKTRIFQVGGESVQALVYTSPLGDFWYLAHVNVPLAIYEEIIKQAQAAKNVLFVRIEPQTSLLELPKTARLIKHRQPEFTVRLDLTKPLADIFANLHQKTRYSLRQAEEKNLRVSSEKNSEIFNSLLKETVARDTFNPHPQVYYEKMLACPLVEQITIFWENKPLASSIFIGFDKTYTYLHSASSSEHREAMASYWAQWSAIQQAKIKGFTTYDFWGVAPEGDEKHSLAGVTRFKIRFGGERYQFGQAFEIPLKPFRYWLFNFLKKIRV